MTNFQKFVALNSSLRIRVEQQIPKDAKGYQIKQYRECIENELTHLCEKVLGILEWKLIPFATSNESKVLSLSFCNASYTCDIMLLIYVK